MKQHADFLRAGVIGLGVGEQHIFGYQADPRSAVVKICDLDRAKLLEVSERHPSLGITTIADEVLSDPDIDVVSIASFDDVHRDQVISAISNGKHVFVEKPLCLTREQLEDISEALLNNPELKLSSNLILRRVPRFADLRKRISSGHLGTVYYLEGDYDYGRMHKLTGGWRGTTPGYSVVHGGAIHLIDLLLWLTGEEVVEVFAYGNNVSTRSSSFNGDDLVVSVLKFRSGTLAKISANFGSVTPHHHNVSVYGTSGTYLQNHLGASYFSSRDAEATAEPVNDPYPGVSKGEMLSGFVASILDRAKPEVSAPEVFRAMDVSISIVESLEAGRPVKVNSEKWWWA